MRRSTRRLTATLAAAALALAAAAGTATARTRPRARSPPGSASPGASRSCPAATRSSPSAPPGGSCASRRTGGASAVVMRVPGRRHRAPARAACSASPSRRDYARDRLVYAYFTTARDNRIVRFRLGGRLPPILTGLRARRHPQRRPDRLRPRRQALRRRRRDRRHGLAQDRGSLNGKILRMNPDGSVPRRQPVPRLARLVARATATSQGLAWDRAGRLWATEFGQDRFDEVNLIRKGRNYGWPLVEGRGSTQGGRFINPLVTWPTSRGLAERRRDRRRAPSTSPRSRASAVCRIPLEGTRLGTPTRAARRPLRAPAHGREGARRLALGDDLQPRRPRSAAPRRRQDHPGRDLVDPFCGGPLVVRVEAAPGLLADRALGDERADPLAAPRRRATRRSPPTRRARRSRAARAAPSGGRRRASCTRRRRRAPCRSPRRSGPRRRGTGTAGG